MKYIVISHLGVEYMFICPKNIHLTHENFADAIHTMKFVNSNHDWQRMYNSHVVSAGFVNNQGWCHGRSESLNIDSREEDSILWAKQYR